MTKINATIVAHSLSPQGKELISVLAVFPRFILAEVNTHRMLSKNTASSRAIPFKKMVETIKNDPFIPIAWQKDHKGMQGSEYLHIHKKHWLRGLEGSIDQAVYLSSLGITKQLCNRLLEPFMWTTMLITGSKEGWENFFNLRCPQYEYIGEGDIIVFKSRKDYIKYHNSDPNDIQLSLDSDIDWFGINRGQAEIHMMALAESIYDAMNESTPKQLQAGEWHIPFEMKIVELLTKPGSGNHSVFESSYSSSRNYFERP